VGEKGKIIKVPPPNIRKAKKFDGKWRVGATPREYKPLGGIRIG